jgi:hypothetical protein
MTILGDTSFIKNGKTTNKQFPQLRNNNGALQTLFNKIFDFGVITSSYNEYYLKPQLENSTNLIAFLKKEYDIEDK